MKGRVCLGKSSDGKPWLLLWTEDGQPRVLSFDSEENARTFARDYGITLGK
jgi:hypothetical protein